MTKTKSTKNIRSMQLLPTTKKGKILSLLGLILIVLLGTYTFRVAYLLPKQERADYLYVEDQLDIAVKSVVKDFSKVRKNKDCSNAEQEFSVGPLVCSLQYIIKLDDTNANNQDISSSLKTLRGIHVTGIQSGIIAFKYKIISCYAYDNTSEGFPDQYSITCNANTTKPINWNRN